MEGNRHDALMDEALRPVFQKEGNVYVKGRSGSGKSTLLLERLHYLSQQGVVLKHTLNLVAYKEDTAHLSYQWKSQHEMRRIQKRRCFALFISFVTISFIITMPDAASRTAGSPVISSCRSPG